jgi:hypothetical protein
MASGGIATIGLVKSRMQETARTLEGVAMLLEESAYRELPKELRDMSLRLCEIREQLELILK